MLFTDFSEPAPTKAEKERRERGKQEPLEHVLVVEKVDGKEKEGPRATSLYSLSLLTFSSSSQLQDRNYFSQVPILVRTANPD